LADTARLKTLGDFRFTDRLSESGISFRFRNRVVADAAKTYKSAHYDRGTGVSVADVDGDGRLDWRNVGGGRFEDITREAGVALTDRVGCTRWTRRRR